MVTVILQHDVQDYATWKTFFDSHQATRAAAGVRAHTVGQLAGSPNTAVIVTQWDTVDAFQTFVKSPDLAEVMKAGGVIGAPTVTIVEGAESKTY